MLDLLWDAHSGPVFDATLELWVAARTDPELRTALVRLEREVTRDTLTQIDEAFGAVAREPGFRDDVEFALATIRGVALLRAASGARSPAVKRRWAAARERLLGAALRPRLGAGWSRAVAGIDPGTYWRERRSVPAVKAAGTLRGTAASERYEAAVGITLGRSSPKPSPVGFPGGLLGEVLSHRAST